MMDLQRSMACVVSGSRYPLVCWGLSGVIFDMLPGGYITSPSSSLSESF